MKKRKKSPALMFQGVSSSSGKSVSTAALCGILRKEGLKVAPFKAQNMSLNSFVTKSGGEMGRAQALQALACGLEPDVTMNPVLLKPMGNGISQIILLGKALACLSYVDYIKIKPYIWQKIKEAYKVIAANADVVVLEGAGSPAEINLQEHDIVNMRMAREAGAAVVLVADIDRGGAFAALAGTMALLRPQDRKFVRAFLLNRFRGERELLKPALEMMEKRYRRPFVGVIPMIENLRLPEEDSASFDLSLACATVSSETIEGLLDVAVLKLPALSNFTDLDPLAAENGLQVRYVDRPEDLGRPDLLVIPGSRKTGSCASWLQASGLDQKVRDYAEESCRNGRGHLVGICAGLQLMGKIISDPHGVEGGGSYAGLGILPIATVLEEEKLLLQTSARAKATICGREAGLAGYEIHHGRSRPMGEALEVMLNTAGKAVAYGLRNERESHCRIWGTYLHGIFDNDDFRNCFLDILRQEAGIASSGKSSYKPGVELDRVARLFMENMDMERIWKILNIE